MCSFVGVRVNCVVLAGGLVGVEWNRRWWENGTRESYKLRGFLPKAGKRKADPRRLGERAWGRACGIYD